MTPEIKLPLETANLIIDDFKNSDYTRLREIALNINHKSDEDNEKGYMPFYAFQVDKDTPDRDVLISQKVADFIIKSHKEKSEEPRNVYRMAIRLKDNGLLIGNVTINMLPVEENGKLIYGDRGCCLDPQYAKRGYANEAVRAVSHEFFKYYDHMDITAHPNNAYSSKLIQRSGGRKVGSKTSNYGRGEPRDIYRIDRADFYKSCAFNQQMPNLLGLLIKRKLQKGDSQK